MLRCFFVVFILVSVGISTFSSSHQLTFIEMFSNAGPVVKLIMIMLIFSSVWSWSIILEKLFLFKRMKLEVAKFEKEFWSSGKTLSVLLSNFSETRYNPMAQVFTAAMEEYETIKKLKISSKTGLLPKANERIAQGIHLAFSNVITRLEKNLSFLATLSSSAPFVGLFGTVWGIMSSFQAIAVSKNTSLAVVAPGIAEALMATAIGLAAAIPALIFYNNFLTDVNKLSNKLEDFSIELTAMLKPEV